MVRRAASFLLLTKRSCARSPFRRWSKSTLLHWPVQESLVALGVEALGGQVQVRWNQTEAATPFGQMAYFAEFLNLTGLYRRWIESCPLRFASPNGSKIADVLGTLFLSVLSGHWRYAHNRGAARRWGERGALGDGR